MLAALRRRQAATAAASWAIGRPRLALPRCVRPVDSRAALAALRPTSVRSTIRRRHVRHLGKDGGGPARGLKLGLREPLGRARVGPLGSQAASNEALLINVHHCHKQGDRSAPRDRPPSNVRLNRPKSRVAKKSNKNRRYCAPTLTQSVPTTDDPNNPTLRSG